MSPLALPWRHVLPPPVPASLPAESGRGCDPLVFGPLYPWAKTVPSGIGRPRICGCGAGWRGEQDCWACGVTG